MKDGIHPKYVKATVVCSCGESFETHSTREVLKIDVCSKCHPFYVGGRQQQIIQRGRVERFRRRWDQTN